MTRCIVIHPATPPADLAVTAPTVAVDEQGTAIAGPPGQHGQLIRELLGFQLNPAGPPHVDVTRAAFWACPGMVIGFHPIYRLTGGGVLVAPLPVGDVSDHVAETVEARP